MQNVICGEFLSLGIMGLPNSRRRHLQVVFCSMELNVRSKQKPISAGISKGHADAAGVDDAKATDGTVELHMRMAANNHICIRLRQDRNELVFRGEPSENVIRILRRSMTEENFAYSVHVHAQGSRPCC